MSFTAADIEDLTLHGAAITVSNHTGLFVSGIRVFCGNARPISSYNSTTAARASLTFSSASQIESPSVTNSGNNGDVTV